MALNEWLAFKFGAKKEKKKVKMNIAKILKVIMYN